LVVIRTSKYTAPKYFLLLAIPLSLSAFTHLWNPIGFPYFVGDEGHYIRRSLQILEQFDPQETARYDHPYFGQLFLAGLFKLIGYPASLNPVSGDVNSTQMLYMVPRIIMGLLAVLDTFLIYKICELLYTRNKAIAFIGSILFAVMPLTWLTRRVYLDSIQLPLILLSILLAIYFYNNSKTRDNSVKGSAWRLGEFINKGTLPIILSGIALGLAIFTKIPALTMIPVIAYLIFRANKKYRERIKNLGLWLIPVILIPAIWPAYAISVGEYDNWYNGVFSQAGREGSGIGSIGILFKIDPVLVSIGIIGLVFATVIKKDLFLLIWIIPFLIFHTIIPWTQHFHWIQVLPVFCIAGALLLDGVASILGRKPGVTSYSTLDNYTTDNRLPSMAIKIGVLSILRRFYDKYLGRVMRLPKTTLIVIMVVPITIFGILSTSLLVTANINSSFFEMVTFVSQSLPNYKEVDTKDGGKGLCLWCNAPINRNSGEGMNEDAKETDEDNKVTVIGNHWIFGTFWIPKYVYGLDHVFKGFFTEASVDTEKVLIVADSRLLDAISSENPDEHIRELQALYGNSTTVAKFEEKRPKFNDQIYPFQSMSENRGIGKIEVKANY
jgi:dolichyl-phosphate-mannose-protein mannosyltransferase